MIRFFKFIICIFTVFSLTGCFGEEYDFSPPTVSLTNLEDIGQTVELAEANINWTYDETYNKKTADIEALAKKQFKINFHPEQEVSLGLDDGQFDRDRVRITLWKNEKRTGLELRNDETFTVPKEKGDYMIEVVVTTTTGTAQYVGSIGIQ